MAGAPAAENRTGLEEFLAHAPDVDVFIQVRSREPLTFEVTAHQKRLYTAAGVDARSDLKVQVTKGSLEEAAGALIQAFAAASGPLVRPEGEAPDAAA